MQAPLTYDRSAELAKSILREWCSRDVQRMRHKLDDTLHSIEVYAHASPLSQERLELLQGVLVEMQKAIASSPDLETLSTCLALLRHLSGGEEV